MILKNGLPFAAAIGIVDIAGTIELPEVFGAYSDVVRQVREMK